MAGIVNEESADGRSLEGISSGQRSQYGDALVEWRSSEQVENGTPSTSPPYWDTDDSDDDGGPKPSELYGKYTWKIEKFSQINKRELRSNAFEVGGYKWYILIYPQGCDVCNHLSLFLCVANHDKLLPGWSHFAQFTIAVVNKDPKKSKYSDTLHRFWKKEHDWGWKKFMELSKVSDGFVDADTLIIKAQVQVIREKQDRPFRCLDCQYRRELVRVYLSNVEQICRRYVEDRRGKLGKLIEDKTRWSSFCAFWLGMDQNARHCLSREKKDQILKVVVKQFFIEKEVTSTLVMDSLYSGLKALEGQSKCKKGKGKLLDVEDIPPPIVCLENDTFVLVDDVLLLLERAAMEPLPPKDEKGPQNRTKDGATGEDCNKDSIERDERRLTELGRRTVEIFVLAHIFSYKIEVAYQEAIALKRQEELIREEEAAWLAESELKAKRGATDKEKKSKKKQGKQKKNNRKGKDKVKFEKSTVAIQVKEQHQNLTDARKDLVDLRSMAEKDDALEDASDISDSVEFAADMLQPDSEDRDASPVHWDTDTSEIHPTAEVSGSGINSLSSVNNGVDKRSSSVMDDSSSTCSTDSTPSGMINGSYKWNSSANYKSHRSPTRGKNRRDRAASEEASEAESRQSEPVADLAVDNDVSPSSKTAEPSNYVASAVSLQERRKRRDQNTVKKEDEMILLQRTPNSKDQVDVEKRSKEMTPVPRTTTPTSVSKPETSSISRTDSIQAKKMPSNILQRTDKATSLVTTVGLSRPDPIKAVTPKPAEKPSGQQVPTLSRPSSAPLIPGTSRLAAPVVSMVQPAPSTPLLSRSVSVAGRLGPDPSSPAAAHGFVPQSYRNAIIGNSFNTSASSFPYPPSSRSGVVSSSPSISQQAAALASAPAFVPRSSERAEHSRVHSWMESPQRNASRSLTFDPTALVNDIQNLDLYRPMNSRPSHELFPSDVGTCTSGRAAQVGVGVADEFPHLDIINDLLDEEHHVGKPTGLSSVYQGGPSNHPSLLNRHLTFPADMNLSSDLDYSSSPCGFERSWSYHDASFQQDYGASSQLVSVRDYIPEANLMPSTNGQIDSLVPNQWQMNGPDLSLLSTMSSGVDGYDYNTLGYSNLANGLRGYRVFRPSNGH